MTEEMKFDQDLDDLLWKPEYGSLFKGELGLLVAAGNLGMCVNRSNRYIFAHHSNPIKAMAYHRGTLLYSVKGTLYDAVQEEEIDAREGTIDSIESHEGKLYYAANSLEPDPMTNEKFLIHGVYELGVSHATQIRNERILALKSFEGKLYDGGNYPDINACFGPGGYHITSFPVSSIEGHAGVLYYTGSGSIKRAEDDMVITGKDLFKSTSSLASMGKRLFAGCLDCNIYSVFTDGNFLDPVYKFHDGDHVFAMEAVPLALWEKLASRGKKAR